ncbi:MAG: hypothetical protein AB7U18_01190 [Dehalococcoidia bacterium]
MAIADVRDAADICGCVPAPASRAGEAISTTGDEALRIVDPPMPHTAHAAAASAAVRPSRALKLVMTVQPRAEEPIAVLLAVGADGCDPLIRSIAVDDLHAALAALIELVAEAEARWADQPRYPMVAAQPAGKQPARRQQPSQAVELDAGTPATTVAAAAHRSDPPDPPHEEPGVEEPVTTAQLSLFEHE